MSTLVEGAPLSDRRTWRLRRMSRGDRRNLLLEWAEWCWEFSPKCRDAAKHHANRCCLNDASRWVYFVRQGVDGPIKVGVADDVAKRLADIQSCNPYTVHCVVAVPGDRQLEVAFHEVLAPFRLHGEWFEPNGALMKLIELVLAYTPRDGVPQESL